MRDHASVAAWITREFDEQFTLAEIHRPNQNRQTHWTA
jgi:hypothetical protein